jgi:hypothetical protein
MTQRMSAATVEIEASGITVEAGSRWFSGSTEGMLRWRLPSSGHELLRALLWDEWLLDDHPGQTDCTTIEPDEVDGFDLDGGSEHPRRWADGSAASLGATDEHDWVRAWVRIEELDRIAIHAEGREQAVDSPDALAEWLDHAFGPFGLPEAFQDWELPDPASLGLVVVSHEPDPKVVSSAAWRMLIRATGLPAELRHEALDLNLVLVPPGSAPDVGRGSVGGRVAQGGPSHGPVLRGCSPSRPRVWSVPRIRSPYGHAVVARGRGGECVAR